jgi:dUTP pyrophosphatase
MNSIINSILFTFSFFGLYNFLEDRNIFFVRRLLVKFNNKNAKIPYRATKESAGLDLFSCETGVIESHSKKMIDIGISVKIPFGYYGRIAPRSGLTIKSSIDVGAGVIDSDYRGNISVILFNHGDEKFTFNKGDKLAQLIIEKIAIVNTKCVNNLDYTERGKRGFGSSGISNLNIGLNYNGNKENNKKEKDDEKYSNEKEDSEEGSSEEGSEEEGSSEEGSEEEGSSEEGSEEEGSEEEGSEEEGSEEEGSPEEGSEEEVKK